MAGFPTTNLEAAKDPHLIVVHRVLCFPVLPRHVFLTKKFVGVQELTDMLLWQGVNGFQSCKRCPRNSSGSSWDVVTPGAGKKAAPGKKGTFQAVEKSW